MSKCKTLAASTKGETSLVTCKVSKDLSMVKSDEVIRSTTICLLF